ncbi:MAG: hypothetical protein FJ388_03090 [Verrucomicrobia bacterium]|nr:hypothetical protein [Verrucomicrobiota bacterium]
MKRFTLLPLVIATTACCGAGPELVRNGSFEEINPKTGGPERWAAAGAREIKQRLSLDTGRDGRRCARLGCTEFGASGPAAHAMICQSHVVSVRRGKWYQIAFWARGEGMKTGHVDMGLSNTRGWRPTGIAEPFFVRPQWQRFEFLCRATDDVLAESSRLQFWFHSTGTLWLDDVTITESAVGQQWYPQIATDNVKNFLPNSSFECGGANWGSHTYGLHGWMGNLYRLEGDVVEGGSHGGHCLKIALSPKTLPVFYFDYYEPIHQPVRRVLAANRGWFRVEPGRKLTLSAFMRADGEGVVAQMVAVEPYGRTQRKAVTVSKEWKRFEFTFAPRESFVFIAAGLDLEESKRDAAVLWLDAVQLERGERASDYAPRAPVETFIETDVAGNTFTRPAEGATITVRACNDTEGEQTVRGKLTMTDFFDRKVFEADLAILLMPRSNTRRTISNVCEGKCGYFLATWTRGAVTPVRAEAAIGADNNALSQNPLRDRRRDVHIRSGTGLEARSTPADAIAGADKSVCPTEQQSLRCAIIEPIGKDATDSPLGFNHAYPWQFLVKLARQAGIVWWRDWSAQWQVVEPQKGALDFSVADTQIGRVLELDSEVDVMLPFPSALWSSAARADLVEKEATSSYLRARLPVAFAPKDLNNFANYAAAVVKHYRAARPRAVTTYQLLNESVYTTYALPQKFGYTIEDYLRLAEIAYRAMKAADPRCRIVAGCGMNPRGNLTREFIEKGGLRFADVFDVHMYDPPLPAESYEEMFAQIEELMRTHGGPKPVWLTEWGCYADDDPPCVPHTVGDAAMNRSRWPSERAATEHIVKFAAVTFAHGMRKIFFHAGTCGIINQPDAGGVLFEYGGAPRKMLPGVAALTRLLGVPDECIKTVARDGHRACVFRTAKRIVAIVWRDDGKQRALQVPATVRACDIMGNELPSKTIPLSESPVYLVTDRKHAEVILQTATGR